MPLNKASTPLADATNTNRKTPGDASPARKVRARRPIPAHSPARTLDLQTALVTARALDR